MEVVALSPESEKERLWRLDREVLRTQMSEERNKNSRKMEGSAKELPLPLDLAGLVATVMMSSSLVTGGSVQALPMRHTTVGY